MPILSRRSFLQGAAAAAAAAAPAARAWAGTPDPYFQHPISHIEEIRAFYAAYPERVAAARKALGRPLTQTEKILFAHLHDPASMRDFKRGTDYMYLRADHLVMQDLLAQTAMLQFMVVDFPKVKLPTSIHCDHLTLAHEGAKKDLMISNKRNQVVYDFLRNVADKYGCDFWEPGAGIIHQETLENYAFPGCLIAGTDSHTPNGSGLGGMAVGVGGADAVDCMTGMEWELPVPKVIGVHVTGQLHDWSAPKDIILTRIFQILLKPPSHEPMIA